MDDTRRCLPLSEPRRFAYDTLSLGDMASKTVKAVRFGKCPRLLEDAPA
jgi:hypothetical protein